mmetsp:Transcript_48603/g.121340  ORF Transcript_48603/g.121340 Transcript_48603/m.121340 type:complete len:217 (+) Transcript_48603:1046-1696(+)
MANMERMRRRRRIMLAKGPMDWTRVSSMMRMALMLLKRRRTRRKRKQRTSWENFGEALNMRAKRPARRMQRSKTFQPLRRKLRRPWTVRTRTTSMRRKKRKTVFWLSINVAHSSLCPRWKRHMKRTLRKTQELDMISKRREVTKGLSRLLTGFFGRYTTETMTTACLLTMLSKVRKALEILASTDILTWAEVKPSMMNATTKLVMKKALSSTRTKK